MSTITKEFTKEQLQQIIETDHVQCGEASALARIALASLEAEPVALRDERSGSGGICKKPGFNDLPHGTPLYAAPPEPVFVPGNSAITQHFDTIALDTAREIMCDVNSRHTFLGGEVQLLSRIQCRIDDACRAAMLQGAEPVSNRDELPDGWVVCSERMPDDMEDVLVTDGEDVKSMWWNGNKWDSWAGKYSIDSEDVTHWMRLPSTPSK